MQVYSNKAVPLMEQFKAAQDAEELATNALLAYLKSGVNEFDEKLKELSDQFESACNKKMQIYQELQQFRLDR